MALKERYECPVGTGESAEVDSQVGPSRCGAFGDYLPNTTSVYMEKQLD